MRKYNVDDEVYVGVLSKPTTWLKGTVLLAVDDEPLLIGYVDFDHHSDCYKWDQESLSYRAMSSFMKGWIIVGKSSDKFSDVVEFNTTPDYVNMDRGLAEKLVRSMTTSDLRRLSKEQLIQLVELSKELLT